MFDTMTKDKVKLRRFRRELRKMKTRLEAQANYER